VWGISSLSGNKKPVETGPIKIGAITPLSGDAAQLGEFFKSVDDLALAEINAAGGINGRQIQVVYEDDRCNGKDALTAFQKLLTVDQVKIVLVSTCSSGVLSVLPAADQNKIFILSGAATSPAITGKSQMFIRTVPSDASQGRVLAEAAIAHGWKKVGIIQESSDYAVALADAFISNYPSTAGQVIREQYPDTTKDFKPLLTKVKGEKPDALFLIPQSPGTAGRLVKQFGDLSWEVPLLVDDVISGNPETVNNNIKTLEGALAAEQGIDLTDSKYQVLEKNYTEKYGKEMAYKSYGEAEYDLINLLAQGLKEKGEDSLALATWAHSIKDWPGVSGLVTIDANGDRVGGHVLKIIKDGKSEVVK